MGHRPANLNRRVFTQSGSKADLTAPKTDFRYTPESGLKTDIVPCPKSATSCCEHMQQVAPLLDHLIGAGKK